MKSDQIANPTKHFDTAADVLNANRLDREEKIQVLQNWANELRQLMTAEEENMSSDQSSAGKLTAVEKALLELGEDSGPHDAKA